MGVTKNRTFIYLAIGSVIGGYPTRVPNLLYTDGGPMELFQMSQHRLVLLIFFTEFRKIWVTMIDMFFNLTVKLRP
jgi:hypothetical protein